MDGIAQQEQRIVYIEAPRLFESRSNPRKHFDEAGIVELAADIEQHGIIQPLVCRGHSIDEIEIVCGARRYRAGMRAGLEEFPVVLRELTDRQVIELQISENAQRADVHPLEECDAFARLLDEHHASVEEVAACVGKPVGYVTQRLRYRHLGPEAREAFLAGKITAGVALLVARVPLHAQAEATVAVGPDWRGELTPVREASERIRARFMLRLVDAPFDRGDTTLVPGAGACSACPKRTGAQPELFDDVGAVDTCIDTTCFAAKANAHRERLVEAERAKGREVLPPGKSPFIYGDRLSYGSGFQKLADKAAEYGDGKKSWAKLLKGHDVPVVVATTSEGRFVELVRDSDLKKAAKKLKLPKYDPHAAASTQAPRAGASVHDVDDRVDDEVRAAMFARCDEGVSDAMVAWLIRETFAAIDLSQARAIAARRGVTYTGSSPIEPLIGHLGVDDPLGLLCEITLLVNPREVAEHASVFGVDAAAIRRRIEGEEAAAAPPPEPPAPTTKASAKKPAAKKASAKKHTSAARARKGGTR